MGQRSTCQKARTWSEPLEPAEGVVWAGGFPFSVQGGGLRYHGDTGTLQGVTLCCTLSYAVAYGARTGELGCPPRGAGARGGGWVCDAHFTVSEAGVRSEPRGLYPRLGFLSFSCSALSLSGWVCGTG